MHIRSISTRLPAALAAAWMLMANPAFAAEPEQRSEDTQRRLEEARKRLDEAAREVADLSMHLYEDAMPRIMSVVGRPRATLGVVIGGDGEPDEGVEILSVSPGGAAQEAGLKAGDVILEINGKALKKEGSSMPREQLLETLRALNPGDKVTLKYRRDGKVNTASVTTRESDRLLAGPLRELRRLGFAPGAMLVRAEGVFGSAELVPLTPKLGQYFGTEKGLLVVRAPADARLQLEDGDVILDIDGRVPSNAAHAFRILGSYQAGEKLKLTVLRMKKRVTFDITIPDDPRDRIRRSRSDLPPMPGTPMPAAPAPGMPMRAMPPVAVSGDDTV
jgi:C-terminal processing protease CtpA/Prc